MNKKKIVVGFGIIIIIFVIMLINTNSSANRIKRQLNIGQKYLDELDYEQAIAAFDKVLEIESDNSTALGYMTDAYIDWSDGLVKDEKYEQAIKVLKEGMEKVKDTQLTRQLEIIEVQYETYKNEKKMKELFSAVQDTITRIAELSFRENYDEIFELMGTAEYEKVLGKIELLQDKYLFDTEYGRIGIYREKTEQYGNYMIYVGDYKNDIRQGKGVWLGYYEGNNYIAQGQWTGDFPNGSMNVKEWNSTLAETVVYRIIDGTVKNGLWNGKVNWCFEEDGNILTYPVTFEQGKWVVLRMEEGDGERWKVVSEHSLEDEDAGALWGDSEIEGIEGFTEK